MFYGNLLINSTSYIASEKLANAGPKKYRLCNHGKLKKVSIQLEKSSLYLSLILLSRSLRSLFICAFQVMNLGLLPPTHINGHTLSTTLVQSCIKCVPINMDRR